MESKCSFCSAHVKTLERVTTVETSVRNIEKATNQMMETINDMRKDILNGIKGRFPASVVAIISILTGLVGMFGAALFMRLQ